MLAMKYSNNALLIQNTAIFRSFIEILILIVFILQTWCMMSVKSRITQSKVLTPSLST